MSVSIIELSGQETDAELKQMAWEMFCRAHPIEAFETNPEAFWEFFQKQSPGTCRKAMEQAIDQFKNT